MESDDDGNYGDDDNDGNGKEFSFEFLDFVYNDREACKLAIQDAMVNLLKPRHLPKRVLDLGAEKLLRREYASLEELVNKIEFQTRLKNRD